METRSKESFILHVLLVFLMLLLTQCSNEPEWSRKNEELIKQYSLKVRTLPGAPNTGIKSPVEGNVTNLDSILSTELYPGVDVKLYWGIGTLAGMVNLEPNAEVPEETLTSDRFVFVMEGTVDQLIDGNFVRMISRKREEPDGTHSATPRIDFVYLEKGSQNAVKAGPGGARIFEVYSPVRLDYLMKAGAEKIPSKNVDLKTMMTPSVKPNTVYDLYDIQYANLGKGTISRVITGKNCLLSFISMEPGITYKQHIHPEGQLMIILRGSVLETVLDADYEMVKNDVLFLPSNMVHGSSTGPLGSDGIDIFWLPRADFNKRAHERDSVFHSVIPEDAKVELVIDGSKTTPGLTFTEGPKWMNGKLYFSNMYFDQAWNGDPKKSSTVEMDPDGTYRYISHGKMQTNGLYPYKNGNLLVCDMMGHRVVEMTTKGQVVKVLANSYNGKSLDGPNDIVTDSKGGIYFTDPQFTAEAVKNQPGRCVYYISPDGRLTRIIEPNEFAMPNGIILSPDGKTAFINNTYDDETWYPVNSEKENFIWAYDIKEDGTLANGRQFAKLILTGNVLDRKGKSTSADGMAIDKAGNLYVATYAGLQIFNTKGEYIGMVNFPTFPVSVCFGNDDMKTLYITSYDKIYRIRTNMEGYMQTIN